MTLVTVSALSPDDARWAAAVMEDRRQLYATYSPVFWHPASGVAGLHARFLRRQIASAANVGLRTGHGFIIGQLRGTEGFVDDFAVDADGTWHGDGAQLLLAAWEQLAAVGASAVRVVTAKADQAKVRMLRDLSLRLVGQWWVKPLRSAGPAASTGRVDGTGFSGLLGPAPPVYEPGGPVLLADTLAGDADLAVLEREAAAMGAVLAVVPTAPESGRNHDLELRQWSVASQWYLGQPAPAPPSRPAWP
jgi:GNAT superfamily N-acetyltransferase